MPDVQQVAAYRAPSCAQSFCKGKSRQAYAIRPYPMICGVGAQGLRPLDGGGDGGKGLLTLLRHHNGSKAYTATGVGG